MAPTLRGNIKSTFQGSLYDSAIAQSAEQMTVNHWVPGSSPGRGAKFTEYSAVGSAPALGAGCREFESLYSDQILKYLGR